MLGTERDVEDDVEEYLLRSVHGDDVPGEAHYKSPSSLIYATSNVSHVSVSDHRAFYLPAQSRRSAHSYAPSSKEYMEEPGSPKKRMISGVFVDFLRNNTSIGRLCLLKGGLLYRSPTELVLKTVKLE